MLRVLRMTAQQDALKGIHHSCCWSSRGFVKARYPNREAALEKNHGVYEPYPCEVHKGDWHLRTPREKK